jgi:hypothetical protein
MRRWNEKPLHNGPRKKDRRQSVAPKKRDWQKNNAMPKLLA